MHEVQTFVQEVVKKAETLPLSNDGWLVHFSKWEKVNESASV
jgi:hypothetical protein